MRLVYIRLATESISHEEMIDIRNSYLVDENSLFLVMHIDCRI